MKRSLNQMTEFQAEFSLANELPYWDFLESEESECIVLADGTLVQGLDFDGNKIDVNKKVQWIRQKGYGTRIVPGSKTNGGKILSPIPELAKRVFKEWVFRSKIRSGLLFQIDGEPIGYRTIEYRYTQALSKAGLPFSATHIIRHASLAEAYETCQDILMVQRLAGQKDLQSTTRYAKVRDAQAMETQRKMDVKLMSIGQ